MEHGATGAEGCLKFVGAECYLGRQADPYEDRNGDQTATAGNGVNQAGNKCCCEEDREK
jgi:hypothetical protein